MRLFNQRDGILSLADARRDANLSRAGAKDQYESDVADFKDSFVTDLENDFMSSDNTFMNPLYMPPSVSLDIPQEEIFLPPQFIEEDIFIDEPIYTPPVNDAITPPADNIYDEIINLPISKPPVDMPPPFRPPVNDFPPFEPPIDIPPPGYGPPGYRPPGYTPPKDGYRPPKDGRNPPYDPPYDPPKDPPKDPPYTPPIDTPTPRPMYRPPTDFSSGAPALNMAITPGEFGTTPGFEPPPPPRFERAPDDDGSKRPPIDRPPYVPPDRYLLERQNNGMKFGGALNAGIMRLPQSQQGDTMTTRIFQNAFKPRR